MKDRIAEVLLGFAVVIAVVLMVSSIMSMFFIDSAKVTQIVGYSGLAVIFGGLFFLGYYVKVGRLFRWVAKNPIDRFFVIFPMAGLGAFLAFFYGWMASYAFYPNHPLDMPWRIFGLVMISAIIPMGLGLGLRLVGKKWTNRLKCSCL